MKVMAKLWTAQRASAGTTEDYIETGLTGRIRHRAARRWYGRTVLVLQTECEVRAGNGAVCRAWRDARVEDLGELGIPDRV
jgi:hypothetical protein